MMELIQVDMSRDRDKCKIKMAKPEDLNDPSAIKLMLTSMHQPLEGGLGIGGRDVRIFLTIPAMVIPLKGVDYIMEVGVLYDQRRYHIWFAQVEEDRTLEETILLRNKALKAEGRQLQRNYRRAAIKDEQSPVDALIQEHLGGLQFRADHEDHVIWEYNGNIHLVCGLGLKAS